MICAVIITLIAQMAAAYSGTPMRIRQLTADDGLSENTVRNIFQDSEGYLWLSTPNGLNRYDGYSFVAFGNAQADMHVKQITEDGAGLLWIETSADIYACIDPKQGAFVNYHDSDEYSPVYNQKFESEEGDVWLWHPANGASRVRHGIDGRLELKNFDIQLTDNGQAEITGAACSVGNQVWFSTTAGLRRVDGDSVAVIAGDKQFAAVMVNGDMVQTVGKNGVIYHVNPHSGVLTEVGLCGGDVNSEGNIYSGNTIMYISSTDGLVGFNLVEETLSKYEELAAGARFATDNKGNGWIGDGKGGLTRIDRITGKFTVYNVMSPAQIKEVGYERYGEYEDERGNIWIATYGNGLFHFDADGVLIGHYSRSDSSDFKFPSDYILCVTGDRNGGVWVGTEHSGLVHLRYPDFDYRYIYPAGKNSRDRANSFRMVTQITGGDILAANRHGELFRLNRALKTHASPMHFSKNVMAAASDGHGEIWLGLRGEGVTLLSGRAVPAPGMPGKGFDIFNIYRDKAGRVWMAMFDKGFGVALPEGDGYEYKSFTDSEGGKTYWRNFAEDANGFIWGATSRGMKVFHPDSVIRHGTKAIHTFGISDGLPGNEVRQVLAGRDGRMWIVILGGGISVCDRAFYNTFPDLRTITSDDGLVNNLVQSVVEDLYGNIWIATERGLSRIDGEDGLIDSYFSGDDGGSNIFLENSSCRLEDGRLLFGTDYGVLAIDPASVASHTMTERVVLTGFELNEENDMTAEFSTFGYSMDNMTLFRYRLEGADRDWSKPTHSNAVTYKSLPPGKYTLKAKARDHGAEWSDEIVVRQFEIHGAGIIPSAVWIIVVIAIGGAIAAVIFRRKQGKGSPEETLNENMQEVSETAYRVETHIAVEVKKDSFTESLSAIVNAHLADADYSIDDFASDMKMSRTALYNIMKSRTSAAPMEYLRTRRLERAEELLRIGTYNVSEVAAMVGIKDPLYFSRSFKSRYGLSPTAYVKSLREK